MELEHIFLRLLPLPSMVYTIMCGMDKELVKADSHIASRAHAAPMPFPCHAAPLPCSDGAMSVKVHVVAGNIRTASPTV